MNEIKKNKSEEHLVKIFSIMRKSDDIVITDVKTRFNKTELRMLREIVGAKAMGERLISTQLAKRLGVTRSAVSQIVNKLEYEGVVKRVPDDVDQKIAYVEITDEILETYSQDIYQCVQFVDRLVEEFGEERFDEMCQAFHDFIDLAAGMIEQSKKNK